MKRISVLLIALVAVVASAEPLTLEERAAAIERASQQPDGIRIVVGHLSRQLGLDTDVLRAEHVRGLNWGEILIAHRLSRSAGRTLDEIVAEFRGGKTWEEIAAAHDVDLPRLILQIQQSQDIVERHAEDRPPHVSGEQPVSPSRAARGGGGMGRSRR